ncbi:MAG TPA: metal-dependent hydrolase [Calditerricola sp.]
MELVYHGHSFVEVRHDGKTILIDPFVTGNPLAKVKPEALSADFILLTHGHGDHVGDAVAIAKRTGATVVAVFELATYLSWQGVSVHPMHIGGSRDFGGFRVKFTPAFHGSSFVEEDGRRIVYTGMPAGILLFLGGKTIYHAGDTALFGDMKLIGERHAPDVAFLPIGDNFTMGPEDALVAAEWVKAKTVVPIHYNTFPLIEQDAHAYVQALKEKGINGVVLESGQSLTL